MIDAKLGTTNKGKTFDKLLELATADKALTANTGTPAVFIGGGLIDADLVLDITTGAAGDIALQFAEDEAFTTPVAGPSVTLTDDSTGRIVVPFRNDPVDKPLPYVRLMPGAAAKLEAFIAKK